MIAIGCATSDERAFRAGAATAIEALDEGDSLLLRHHHCEAIDVPYNEMLATATARDDLDAIVFVHQDAVLDGETSGMVQLRSLFEANPDVAVIGVGDAGSPVDVRTVDGTMLALSAWAARNLSFDPALGGSVDASAQDLSLQARAADRRVLAAPLGVMRPWLDRPEPARQRELIATLELKRKWDDQASCPPIS